ncbi:MAG: DUF4810 domain-containing protein [Prevotellaceae bacterium]|jgi:hypothetical protein|nr:DUF4810 domain-containing protein [Prevotellaceae bacterium]
MKKNMLIAGCVLLLSSCAPTTLYNWGNYQAATYDYVKTGTDKDAATLSKTYQYIIDNPIGKRGVVPPGIYADYGYLLFKQGKTEEALKYMKMEIGLYSESTVFVGRIIEQLEK